MVRWCLVPTSTRRHLFTHHNLCRVPPLQQRRQLPLESGVTPTACSIMVTLRCRCCSGANKLPQQPQAACACQGVRSALQHVARERARALDRGAPLPLSRALIRCRCGTMHVGCTVLLPWATSLAFVPGTSLWNLLRAPVGSVTAAPLGFGRLLLNNVPPVGSSRKDGLLAVLCHLPRFAGRSTGLILGESHRDRNVRMLRTCFQRRARADSENREGEKGLGAGEQGARG